MKIRTLGELQDAIDADMGWRKRELTAIKTNIQVARKFAKDTALRSGIALLYAHWEGAIKNIAYYYLVYVSGLKLPYNAMKLNFYAISLRSELDGFMAVSKASLHTKIVNDMFEKYTTASQIPKDGVIRTNSNLNSLLFSEILHTIGLNSDIYESYYNLIDEVLLSMRNKIAHGERLDTLSLDESRYIEIHEKIFVLIDQFAVQVSNAAILKEYLK